MRLNALIVDDEHSGRTTIKLLLEKNYYLLFNQIDTAETLDVAQRLVYDNFYDICFLDIQLGNHSGFELIPFLPVDTKVVFVTAYSEFAIKAIKVKAFDYILKPIDPMDFMKCMGNIEKSYDEAGDIKKFILIKEQGASRPVPLAEIEYLEADGAYSSIFTVKKKRYLTSKTLKENSKSLSTDFLRVHKSFIVNMTLIKSFNKNSLTTIHNKCLPVSRIGSKELQRYFS